MNDARESRIRGKVARLLNAREIALNIGEKDGVAVGMRFDVLDPNGEDIRDPDTGDYLGSLERPKIRVEISLVDKRLSIARTFREKKINQGGEGSFSIAHLGRIMTPPDWVTVVETLRASAGTWEELDESESIVKIGDPVVEVRSAV